MRIEHPHVDYNYTYDRHNRVHTVTDHRQGIGLTYDYTPAGKLNSVRDSTGKQASYLYDDAGRLAGLVAPNGDKATLTLDPGGRLQALDLSNGVKARYTYDAGDRLTQVINRTSAGLISQHDYSYDTQGRRATREAAVIEGSHTHRLHNHYHYDSNDQLTGIDTYDTGLGQFQRTASYTYDVFGNRRSHDIEGTVAHYAYDNAQQPWHTSLSRMMNGRFGGTV